MLSALRRLNPYLLVILVLLLAADVGGIVYAFRAHGTRDGVIALVLPPYGLYRAAEAMTTRAGITDQQGAQMAQSDTGRRELANDLHLRPEVWTALVGLIQSQKTHDVHTTMNETGIPYDVVASVPPQGPITLTIQSRANPNLTIAMIDATRGQEPDTLQITKRINGVPEVHTTPLSKFTSDDASQFLLAWSLAWGTIAEQLRAPGPTTTSP